MREFEIEKYIDYRLKIAGSNNRIFDSKTTSPIFAYSREIPRKINKICDLALLTGYKRKNKTIKPKLIKYCNEKYNFNYNNSIKNEKFNKFRIRVLALAFSIIMIFVSGYFFYLKYESIFPVSSHAIYANVLQLLHASKIASLLHKPNKALIELRTPIDPILGIINFSVQMPNENEISPLAESKNSYNKFDFILSENDNTNTRSVPFNTAVAEERQQIPQTNQELIEMDKTLKRIKKENELLRAELASKDIMIKELQKSRNELKNAANNYVEEIEALKTQLLSRKLEKETYPSLPSNSKIEDRLTLDKDEVIDNDLQPHNPNDIIDYIIQKK